MAYQVLARKWRPKTFADLVGQELADRDIFGHVVRVALSLGGGVGEPARPVVSRDSQTEPAGVDLLTHISGLPSSCLPCRSQHLD